MKKLVTFILSLLLLLPVVVFADQPDVTVMTDQELKDLITACSAELRSRATTEPEGTLIFEMEGFKVYQKDEAYVSSDFLFVPVSLYNENEFGISFSPENTICNGWDIYSAGGTVSAKAKSKEILTFNIGAADVTDTEQIDSFKFVWSVYNSENYNSIYEQKEPEEHRFW